MVIHVIKWYCFMSELEEWQNTFWSEKVKFPVFNKSFSCQMSFGKVETKFYRRMKWTYRKCSDRGGSFGLFKSLMISKAPCSDGRISSGAIHDRTCSIDCNGIDSRTMTVVGRRVSKRTWNFWSDGRKGVRHPFYFAIAPWRHFIRLLRLVSTTIHQIDGGDCHLGPDKSNYFNS